MKQDEDRKKDLEAAIAKLTQVLESVKKGDESMEAEALLLADSYSASKKLHLAYSELRAEVAMLRPEVKRLKQILKNRD
ncbi:hypothetical protein [uncultured Tateyamaria sp.]|uniref:hypothetical protein n=1 Tax=uncultured Tateyamaria sp. TaxID=455651 RepID=UPI0026070AE6|nr:hypothetical protein [uncultured Tateyamaria sp.]